MLYYSLIDISAVKASDTEMMLKKIKHHFSDRINLKRIESVLSKALLCFILEEHYGLSDFFIDCDEKGKPFIVDGKLFFNLSHSGKYVMCVCGDENVGCDIQQVKPYNEKVAKRFFTPEENELLEKSNDKARVFTSLWTLKESALKLSGEGISGGLDRYDFSKYYNKEIFSMSGMSFYRTESEDYIFAICSSDAAVPTYIDITDIKINYS